MNIRKKVVLDALRFCLVFAPVSYIGFFLNVGVPSYSVSVTGRFFNAILNNQHAAAQSLLGTMLFTLLVAVVALPVFALATNIIIFHFALKHDLYLTSACYKKNYEQMKGYSGGGIVQRLFRDPYQLRTLVAITPAQLLAQVSALVFMVILMVRVSPALSLVCVSLGALGAVCPLLFMRKLARLDEAKKGFDDRTADIELEMVQNRNFFQSYGLEDFFPAKQGTSFRHYDQGYLRRGVWTEAIANLLPESCLLLGNIAFLLIGLRQAQAHQIGGGDLMVFFSYLTITMGIVKQIYNQGRKLVQLPKSIDRVVELIDHAEREEGVSDCTWSSIHAHGLTYRYSEDSPTIEYADFDIRRNDLVEIRGRNGTGKTTLVQLLCGLLVPKSGEVTVGHHRLKDIDLSKWRDNITCIEQSPTIFRGTLRENIHIGNLGASPEKVDDVLSRLHLHEQADRELTTAQQLSGGEMKKVALGRALLRDANIVFFDEPFEHLDIYGQQVVNEMLSDTQRTRICIQHRDSHAFTAMKLIQL